MLRAYSRPIVDTINRCREVNTFIPALGYTFAKNPTEIEVDHEERFAGESKYSLYKLIRLNFDLVTGFSVVPLQWFSAIGMLLSLASAVLFVLLVVRRFVLGAEVQGVFTLFAITFFLMGCCCSASGCWASTSAGSTSRCASVRATWCRACWKTRPTCTRPAPPT